MSDAASAAAPCPVVRARSILQKVRYDGNEWFGIDYNMKMCIRDRTSSSTSHT